MRRFIIDDIYYIILVFEKSKSKFTAGSMVKSNKFYKKTCGTKLLLLLHKKLIRGAIIFFFFTQNCTNYIVPHTQSNWIPKTKITRVLM